MRMSYWILALSACATTGTQIYSTPEWTWSDGEQEREAILCAALEMYGPAIADKLARVPVRTFTDYPFNGLNYGGIIGLLARAPTARSSAWSHEAVHWLDHAATGKWTEYPHCEVAPFKDAELRFNAALQDCRIWLEGYDP